MYWLRTRVFEKTVVHMVRNTGLQLDCFEIYFKTNPFNIYRYD